jgi:hypothetical protein
MDISPVSLMPGALNAQPSSFERVTPSLSSSSTAATTSFNKVLSDTQPTISAAKVKAPTEEKIIHDFSVMIGQQFIGEILKDQFAEQMGDGFEADYYTSVFSKAVAESLADQDAFGLSSMLNVGAPENEE